MNYKQSIRALFEAVINVEVEKIQETKRATKDRINALMQKRFDAGPKDPEVPGSKEWIPSHMFSNRGANLGVGKNTEKERARWAGYANIAVGGPKGGDKENQEIVSSGRKHRAAGNLTPEKVAQRAQSARKQKAFSNRQTKLANDPNYHKRVQDAEKQRQIAAEIERKRRERVSNDPNIDVGDPGTTHIFGHR